MAGEGNNNDNKGKKKMVFPSETVMKIAELLKEKLSAALSEIKSQSQGSHQSNAKPQGTEETSKEAEWDDPFALELEEIIISNLKVTLQCAIKTIVERHGYTEEQAEWAVLSSGIYHGEKDTISNIVDSALPLLGFKNDVDVDTSTGSLFDDLDSLASYLVIEMVNVLKELRPSICVSEAMWLLLLSDVNMIHAAELDAHQQFMNQHNPENCSSCASRLSQLLLDTPRGTSPQLSDISHSCEFTLSGMQRSILVPPMEGTSSGFIPASGAARKEPSLSMKDLIRQKAAARCEKGKKGPKGKGKGFYKTRVTTTSIDVTSGKMSQPFPSSGKNKGGSIKINSKGEIVSTLKQESKQTVITSSSAVPLNEEDEEIKVLMQQKQDMEEELRAWSEWTHVKVGQAAQMLSKIKPELKMLRQERQEAEDFQDGKLVIDDNTVKKYSEMALALSNDDRQLDEANSAARRLEAERAMLKKGLEDSKLKYVNCSKNLQEAKVREQELLKQCRAMEAEIGSLKGVELAGLKSKGANLKAQIDKARKRANEFEALRKHEEKEKEKYLRLAETIKSETEKLMNQAKAEEENLIEKAKANKLMFEDRMKELNTEIAALKLKWESGKEKTVKRERECVMCLTEEKSVVFLPCAHQLLCKDCNVLHEQKGMNDCPTCRAPIKERINARFVLTKAP